MKDYLLYSHKFSFMTSRDNDPLLEARLKQLTQDQDAVIEEVRRLRQNPGIAQLDVVEDSVALIEAQLAAIVHSSLESSPISSSDESFSEREASPSFTPPSFASVPIVPELPQPLEYPSQQPAQQVHAFIPPVEPGMMDMTKSLLGLGNPIRSREAPLPELPKLQPQQYASQQPAQQQAQQVHAFIPPVEPGMMDMTKSQAIPYLPNQRVKTARLPESTVSRGVGDSISGERQIVSEPVLVIKGMIDDVENIPNDRHGKARILASLNARKKYEGWEAVRRLRKISLMIENTTKVCRNATLSSMAVVQISSFFPCKRVNRQVDAALKIQRWYRKVLEKRRAPIDAMGMLPTARQRKRRQPIMVVPN